MKSLYINSTAILLAMACRAASEIDRGLNASLAHEDAQKGTAAQELKSAPGGNINRGLNASIHSADEALTLGLTGRVAYVHRKDHEGLLAIDAFTGRVIPESVINPDTEQAYNADRPAWAEDGTGLVVALLTERLSFYAERLGASFVDSPNFVRPEVLAFEDLGWIGLDLETGEEKLIEADAEHRMDVLVAVAAEMGIKVDREEGTLDAGETAQTLELRSDMTRDNDCMKSFTEAQEKGFEADKQTATGS